MQCTLPSMYFFREIKDAPLLIVLLTCLMPGYLVAAFYFVPKPWKLKREHKQMLKFNKELKALDEMNRKKNKPASEVSTNPEGIELDDDDDFDNPFFKD